MPLFRRFRKRNSEVDKRGESRLIPRRTRLEMMASIINLISALILLLHAVWTVMQHLWLLGHGA